MKKRIIKLIYLLFVPFSFVSADAYSKTLELIYFPIRGFKIIQGQDIKFANYIVYFFDLFVVTGTALTVIVIIVSGIQILLSRGQEFSSLAEAKKRLYGAILGFLILLGIWGILYTINPYTLITDQIEPTVGQDLSGINLIQSKDGYKVWLGQNNTKTQEAYSGIEWLSSSDDLPKIYVYSQAEFKGTLKEIKNGESADIPQGSSIYFFWNQKGVYFYDKANYENDKKPGPLYLIKSEPALANVNNENFNKITKSIDFTQYKIEEKMPIFTAILFSESDYLGKCSWASNDLASLNSSNGDENNPTIGENNLSSVMIIKTKEEARKITFYNRTNCQYIEKDPISKKCEVSGFNKNETFNSSCSDLVKYGDVLSFEIGEKTGVLIRSQDGNYCQYFKKDSANGCINVIKYSNVYTPDNFKDFSTKKIKEIKPYYFTIFAIEE